MLTDFSSDLFVHFHQQPRDQVPTLAARKVPLSVGGLNGDDPIRLLSPQ